MKRKSIALTALLLALALLCTACTGAGGTTTSAATTAAATTAAATTAAATTATTPAAAAATEFTMFYQEANQNFPEGFQHIDNWFLNYICEQANVKITELIVPAYADTETKYNLMMSSGEIPDLVERADSVTMKQYGMEGAFRPTLDIIQKSAVLSALYDDTQLSAMQSSDGVAYVIQIPPLNDDFSSWWVRDDLLEKYGMCADDGVTYTLDELVEAARLLKADDANALPFSWTQIHGAMFWPFNVCGLNWGLSWTYRPEENKVVSPFEGGNITSAVSFWRDQYEEGLLDQEFMTNTSNDYMNKKLTRDVLVQFNNVGSVAIWIQRFVNAEAYDVRITPIITPMAEGVGVDQAYATPSVLGGYTFGVNAKADGEKLDGICRFLDVIFGDEIRELSTYGREGTEYELKDGVPTPIFPAATESSWISLYGWATVNSAEKLSYGRTMNIMSMTALDDDVKTAYVSMLDDNIATIMDAIYGKYSYSPQGLAQALPDEELNRQSEAVELMKSLCAQVIIGEISLEDFEAEKEAVVTKYQSVTDAWNTLCDEARAKYGL